MNNENSIPDIPIERIPLTRDFITLAIARTNGFIGAYTIPGVASILEKKDYLSIRSERPLSDEIVFSIAKRILGKPYFFAIEDQDGQKITRVRRLSVPSDLSDKSNPLATAEPAGEAGSEEASK